ncbi:ribonuclease H-like domain-containing protein [Tanacetum coccineum]
MNCHATTTSPIPRSHLHALRDPNWHKAMVDEYNALISNGTWALVPVQINVNIVRSMWLFKHKFNADGSLSRLIFFHGQLSETVYMHQPPGFVDSAHPDYVCHLQRSLYGLKQAPRAWFQRFASFITRAVFSTSLYKNPSSTALLQRIITLLHSEFAMTDLGSLNYFLGVSAQRSKSGLFLSQSKFAEEILERDTWRFVTLSRSSAEAEYRGVANVVAETAWIRNLLLELHTPLFTATLVYCDNVGSCASCHFRFSMQLFFTKGLPTALFLEFRSSLNVRRSPAHTEGEY